MGVKREILFRGKRQDNGKWVEGSFVKYTDCDGDKVYLIYASNGNPNNIIPETVGQFTGLIDLNGKKIFEGDIIADYFGKVYGVVEYGEGSFDSGILKYTGFYCKSSSISNDGNLCNESNKDYWNRHQVIGNIYDNPELLKLEKRGNPKEKKGNKKVKNFIIRLLPIITIVITFAIIGVLVYLIITSDIPDWLKFWLLR